MVSKSSMLLSPLLPRSFLFLQNFNFFNLKRKRKLPNTFVCTSTVISGNYFPVQFTILLMFVSQYYNLKTRCIWRLQTSSFLSLTSSCELFVLHLYRHIRIYTIHLYTGCPRRNMPDLGRVFLMLNYTDITQNTYVQSRTVTEIMAREKCGRHGFRNTIRRP